METLSWTITAQDVETGPLRLDHFLSRKTGQSRAFLQEQIEAGNVSVCNQVVKKPSTRVRAGDEINAKWIPQAIAEGLTPVDGNLRVIWEDENLLAIDKAPGVVVHPASAHEGATLVHYVLHHLGLGQFPADMGLDLRPGIVHRLDVGTSGVIVFAKNRKVQEHLSSQFKDRTVEKEYEALVWGTPPASGQFKNPIGRDKNHRTQMSSRSDSLRPALTVYERFKNLPPLSHMRLFPKTGRTHQLRVHLAEGGFPIVGDPTYGKRIHRDALPAKARPILDAHPWTFLHARRLKIHHPITGERLEFMAPPPPAFAELWETLG